LTEEQVQELGASFVDYFSPPHEHGFSSLYIQTTELPGQVERNLPRLIFGQPKTVQKVLGIEFDISPDAFFQVNTDCAAVSSLKKKKLVSSGILMRSKFDHRIMNTKGNTN